MENLEKIRAALPEAAKDLKLNLQSVLTDSKLDENKRWGVAIACAISVGDAELTAAVLADAKVDEATLDDAKAAASLMGMNNVYYRFRHFMEGSEVEGDYKLPARLRMNRIARPAGDKVAFELYCLAVSAINGCEACVRSHEAVVRKGGMTADEVHDAVRIAAVLHGVGHARRIP
ncbi:MAG: carboxymuconolactone decarboxylase family protein [Sandaracinus sp.]|nr:carboxymuconolactone decarboxylase family protein [Sandaracinus sp.]MCB9612996.1 carboxymuconolactone decarboxylase family protein [Sandaracinus sp.]MCB9619140.1 carboxymuconolactone decarboxylase family protein [Sandaracinus sp.]MCB9632723.1 carboxymuconolactone decarboxylase family protein [Sandaracinus sp.]